MSIRLSELIGKEVYTDEAKNLGKIYDVVMDLPAGQVVRLALAPLASASQQEITRIFREKTILFRNVKSIQEIVLVSSHPVSEPEEEAPSEPEPKKHAYSYRYRK